MLKLMSGGSRRQRRRHATARTRAREERQFTNSSWKQGCISKQQRRGTATLARIGGCTSLVPLRDRAKTPSKRKFCQRRHWREEVAVVWRNTFAEDFGSDARVNSEAELPSEPEGLRKEADMLAYEACVRFTIRAARPDGMPGRIARRVLCADSIAKIMGMRKKLRPSMERRGHSEWRNPEQRRKGPGCCAAFFVARATSLKLNAAVLFTDCKAAHYTIWTVEAIGRVLTNEAKARILTRFVLQFEVRIRCADKMRCQCGFGSSAIGTWELTSRLIALTGSSEHRVQ